MFFKAFGFQFFCVIPKLFLKAVSITAMKLTRSKLIETLKAKNNRATSYQARKIAGISVRRVDQVWKPYKEKGEILEIGKNDGCPRKKIEKWEVKLVKRAYENYRVSADTLERLIDRDYKKHIGHNRIHEILIELGFARPKKKKVKQPNSIY